MFPKENILVMRLAADLEEYNSKLINIEKYRDKYQIHPGDRIIVNAGTTNMVKTKQGWVDFQDMSTVINALPIILQKYPQTKFILLGIENDQTVIRLIKELNLAKYVILGSKFMFWKEEHLSTLAIADCLCLPTMDVLATRYYCKYKVLDYMLAKRPIISADTPGLKETFRDSALYYKPGNAESLAEQLIYCFENPIEMQEKAQQTFQLLTTEHLWEQESKQLNDFIYNRLQN
jgi:glycosyltransferase involved in cell wall biosynthesis